jgi:hypothetical protein
MPTSGRSASAIWVEPPRACVRRQSGARASFSLDVLPVVDEPPDGVAATD